MKIWISLLIIILVLLLIYLWAVSPRMIKRPDRTALFNHLYAHRGLHRNGGKAPENSLAAFQKAVDAGLGIELDVQLTKDEEVVVFHDFTLDRVCGVKGRVCDYTYEELQQFSLAGSDQKIPKFTDFLKIVDGKVPFILEYKVEWMDPKVCPLTNEILKDYKGVYCIESFNPTALMWYKKNRPDVFRGILSENYFKEKEDGKPKVLFVALWLMLTNFLFRPDFQAYNHKHYKNVSRVLCRKLFKSTAVAWTIKSQEQLDARAKDFDMFIFDSFVPRGVDATLD